MAGPIVRAADFLPQCEVPRRPTLGELSWGSFLMVLGMVEKIIFADLLLARTADKIYSLHGPVSTVDAWIGTLAFAGQIFFDFAGYSTCGIGAALCLGFKLKRNFHFPYAAVGFSDFWRRWHISLSTWLARLSLHSAGRQPRQRDDRPQKPDGDDAARRPVARCQLAIRHLGRPARQLPAVRASAAPTIWRFADRTARIIPRGDGPGDLCFRDVRLGVLPRLRSWKRPTRSWRRCGE